MNKKNLLVTAILTCMMAFGSVNADGTTIKDMNKSSGFAKDAIIALAEQNIISGDAKGNFNPGKQITRGELVVLMVKALKIDTTNVPTKATFTDVPTNHWAFKYVEAAYREGIITGVGDNKFGINQLCPREQIAVIFVRALDLVNQTEEISHKKLGELKDQSKISSWAKNEVDMALTAGLMTGTGQNNFSPKNAASKEQVAVVLDRFMKNEDKMINSINESYNVNKNTKVILNGDMIASEFYTIDENNNIFVSKKYIDKYIVGMESAVPATEHNEMYFDTSAVYASKNISGLWFKVGSTNAYKNIANGTTTPYGDETQNVEKVIVLETAPMIKEGTLFIPLKDLTNILADSYNVDIKRNRIYIEDKNLAKYPNLNRAAKAGAYNKYIGDMDSVAELSAKDLATKEQLKLQTQIFSRINEDAAYSAAYIKIQLPGEDAIELETEEIVTANKVYILGEDNKWTVLDKDEVDGSTSAAILDPFASENAGHGIVLNPNFIDNYSKLPVKKMGTAKVGNVIAEKYLITIDEDSLQYILGEEQYNETIEAIKETYNGTLRYDMELYVASEQIVRMVVRLTGQEYDKATGSKADVKLLMTVDFKNIGINNPIEMPKASEIIQPE